MAQDYIYVHMFLGLVCKITFCIFLLYIYTVLLKY
jgi:hypothetical protein